jgi:uridine kinase
MRGDKLVIREEHIRAATQIVNLLLSEIESYGSRFIITVAGESGSGKSEIAAVVSDKLEEKNIRSIILQQDDYFVYPPKTNARMRKENIEHVGLSEVHLQLLDENCAAALEGRTEIVKPLVIFEEDAITEETISLDGIDVIIVEGTYTTTLEKVQRRVFIDRTYIDTRDARKRRAREAQDEFLERILEIEHEIISAHKERADLIVTHDYEVERAQ